MASKIWFVTGASRGLGRIWAEAALARGDRVVATARDVNSIADLRERFGDAALPLALDVTSTGQAQAAISQAYEHFDRLDVVINNAGYTLVGTVEEASEADIRAIFETNYFGMVRVLKAVLPRLRAQGAGHVVGVSSRLGLVGVPLLGFYSTTKWAVEGLHDSLAQEVKAFGIKVTLIEPGAYATDFGSGGSVKIAQPMEAYAELRRRTMGQLAASERGDPRATVEAVLRLVDADEPPLRLALGSSVLPTVRAAFADRLETWKAWETVSNGAQGGSVKMTRDRI